MFMIYQKIKGNNERSPVPELEPETPPWLERPLTTMPQLHD